MQLSQICVSLRVRNYAHAESFCSHTSHRKANAIDCHRALFHNITHQVARHFYGVYICDIVLRDARNFACAIYVARNYVPAETPACGHSALQIHYAARAQVAQRRAAQCFVHHIGAEGAAHAFCAPRTPCVSFRNFAMQAETRPAARRIHFHNRQAHAIHGYAVACVRGLQNTARSNG